MRNWTIFEKNGVCMSRISYLLINVKYIGMLAWLIWETIVVILLLVSVGMFGYVCVPLDAWILVL